MIRPYIATSQDIYMYSDIFMVFVTPVKQRPSDWKVFDSRLVETVMYVLHTAPWYSRNEQ